MVLFRNLAERLSRLFSVSPIDPCVSAPTCGTSISAVIVFARMASPSKLSSPNGALRYVSYCDIRWGSSAHLFMLSFISCAALASSGSICDGPSLKSTLLIVPVKGNGTW